MAKVDYEIMEYDVKNFSVGDWVSVVESGCAFGNAFQNPGHVVEHEGHLVIKLDGDYRKDIFRDLAPVENYFPKPGTGAAFNDIWKIYKKAQNPK